MLKQRFSRSISLVGRIFAILLLTVLLEFAVGTLIYERASHLSLQEDEARRLAEHLVIARKLMAEQPREERKALAVQLTTERYDVHWTALLPPPPPLSPDLDKMRRQIISWEPSLGAANLRLRVSPGRKSELSGGLKLPDGSWLYFGTHLSAGKWGFTIGRMGLALIPVLALLLIGGILIRRTLQPLRVLAKATERIGISEEVEVAEAGTQDVRHLIRAFNVMQGRIHRLIAERTEMLAAVGHDMRTPLARLQLRLEGVDDRATRAALEGDISEMGAMINSLLAFLGGERDSEAMVRSDIAVTLATIADDGCDRGHKVSYVGPDHLEMMVRPVGLRRAVGNLVENAIHYGQCARILLTRADDGVIIAVEDDGPGIPEHRLRDVLHPFTRLDTARQRNTRGLGLGLSIVQRLVEQEGGVLTLSNRAKGGLRAEIRLKGE